MAKRFTTVKLDAFKQIQLEAGVIMKNFNPANPVINRADILLVTTGGINPVCKPNFIDYYDDVDNMPANTKQGKQIDYYDCSISTTHIFSRKVQGHPAQGCQQERNHGRLPFRGREEEGQGEGRRGDKEAQEGTRRQGQGGCGVVQTHRCLGCRGHR